MYTGYNRIKEAFTSLLEDDTVNRETQYDAECLLRQMEKFEIVFLCIFWNDVLTRVNTTSKYIQTDLSHQRDIVQENSIDLQFLEDLHLLSGFYETKAKAHTICLKQIIQILASIRNNEARAQRYD